MTIAKTLVAIFFFFQAEDGIRDGTVTGAQTCALPISRKWSSLWSRVRPRSVFAKTSTLIALEGERPNTVSVRTERRSWGRTYRRAEVRPPSESTQDRKSVVLGKEGRSRWEE